MVPSNSKIEDRAIGTLRNIIDDHPTMRHKFNSMDKEMSWDGYIWLYQSIVKSSEKENYDDKVPVQVKGHIDKSKQYINKQRITYEVDLADLQVYFRDRGVLFFQIFMSENGKKREVFYSSLFPTKIKYYLENAHKKGNRKNINITFTKLPKRAENLYIVAKQFSNESKKQGFGHEQLVQHAIKVDDMDKIKSISASVVGAANEYEFMQSLGSGDVSFYGKMEGVPISIPLEWHESSIFYLTKEVIREICVGNKKYYDKYKICTSSQKEITIIPSDNLKINMNRCKFTFRAQTNIKNLRHDADFLFALMLHNEFLIADHSFPYGNPRMPDELRQELEFYINLDDTLEMIGFEYTKAFKDISPVDIKLLEELVEMRRGKKNDLLTEKVHIYNWKLENKYVPLIVIKGGNGEENRLYNAIYATQNQCFVKNGTGEYLKIPIYAHIDKHVIKALYEYKYDYFYAQIDDADINDDTSDTIVFAALNLIHAYDSTKDSRLLEIASFALNKLTGIIGKNDRNLLNELQIKKRISDLDEVDRRVLETIESDNLQIMCGKYILLDAINEFENTYKLMPEDDQKYFSELPIYTLYCEYRY